MRKQTVREIRAWGVLGRRIQFRFPRFFSATEGRLSHWENEIAERTRSDLIMLFPQNTRRGVRRIRLAMHALKGTRRKIIVALPRQLRDAQIMPDGIEVIQQVPGWKGLPMSLIQAQIGDRWNNRTGYLLMGYDEHEGRFGYFFCELPPKEKGKKYKTVAEGFEALKPDSVKTAEGFNRAVKRQGDMFAIPIEEFDPAKEDPEFALWGAQQDGYLMGTNHRATEVVVVGEKTYARGRIVHDPEDRRRDHKSVRLGKTWHRIVKNTVPVEAPEKRKERW